MAAGGFQAPVLLGFTSFSKQYTAEELLIQRNQSLYKKLVHFPVLQIIPTALLLLHSLGYPTTLVLSQIHSRFFYNKYAKLAVMSANPPAAPAGRRAPARASKIAAQNRIVKSYDKNLRRPIKISRRGGDAGKRDLTQQGIYTVKHCNRLFAC
jgi:hypothetical protein